jgi:hypothetical protein
MFMWKRFLPTVGLIIFLVSCQTAAPIPPAVPAPAAPVCFKPVDVMALSVLTDNKTMAIQTRSGVQFMNFETGKKRNSSRHRNPSLLPTFLPMESFWHGRLKTTRSN